MVRRCAVRDCPSTDLTTLCHRFPRKTHMAEMWQQSLHLLHISLPELYLKKVVCTLHFTADDYRNELSKNLNVTAVPTTIQHSRQRAATDSEEPPKIVQPHDLNFSEFVESATVSAGEESCEEHIREEEEEEIDEQRTNDKSDMISLADGKLSDVGPDQIAVDDDDPGQFYQDDSNMNYDTGDLSFPDPCKDLPNFSTSDFLLEPPEALDSLPEVVSDQQQQQDIAVSDDQFVYIMEVPTPTLEDDDPPAVLLDTNEGHASAGHQVRVSIEDGQLVFQTTNHEESSSFGNYQLVSTSPTSFGFDIGQQLQEEMQQMASEEPEEYHPTEAPAASAGPALFRPKEADEDDVFTDEMRLYNEMSKKSLVQLMVKANGKIRELEERLETIEAAHSKVLGSLELFRNVLRP